MATEKTKAAEREAATDAATVETVGRKAANPAHSLASEETAVVNSAAQTEDPGLTDRIKRARGEGVANLSQGENANGEDDSRTQNPEPDLSQATFTSKGGEKVTREEGTPIDPNFQGHVVQQGGGGVVAPSGAPIR